MGVLAAVSFAALSAGAQIDAQSEQRKANRELRGKQRAQAIQERRQQLRQARVQRAAVVNEAAISGGEGSVLAGATNSIGQQLAQNTAFIESTQRANERAFKFNERASKFGLTANIFSQFASFGASGIGPQQPQPQTQPDKFGFQSGQDPFNPNNFSR